MVEITVKPASARNVTFQEDNEPDENERKIINKVVEIIGNLCDEEKILRFMRSDPKCSDTPEFISDIVNRLLDVGDDGPTILPISENGKESVATTQTSEQMDITHVIPLNSVSAIKSGKPFDREDSDLQKALQESLKVSQINLSSFHSSLPDDLETIIRNPNLSTGLHNAGNTCWFNCVAQVLYHLPKFRSILYFCVPSQWQSLPLTSVTPDNVKPRDLLMRMRRLFAEMQFSTVSYIDTTSILEVVDALTRKNSGELRVLGHQQDATESLIRIIDWLEIGVKRALSVRLSPVTAAEEEQNYIPADSTSFAPNFDAAIGDLPSYEAIFQEDNNLSMPNILRPSESRPNSPVNIEDRSKEFVFENLVENKKEDFDEPMELADSEKSIEEPKFAVPLLKKEICEERSFIDVPEGEKEKCDAVRHELEEIFEATIVNETYSTDDKVLLTKEIRNCPQFFHLQVSYGDLHDALEANTFDTGKGSAAYMEINWFETLPAAIFMGLSRFGYKDGMPEKLHNRFTFPKTLYMDRYLKKNSKRVLELRKQRMEFRETLAQTKALHRGLLEYPHGTHNTTRIFDAFQTVLNVLTNSHSVENPIDPEDQFIGPFLPNMRPVVSPPTSFVKDLGKKFTQINPDDFKNIETCSDTLKAVMEMLEKREEEFRHTEILLEQNIDNIYEMESLHQCEYKLHALIIHSGEANRGHYWTYTRAQSTHEEKDEWERLNDKKIEVVSWQQVENDAYGNGTPSSSSAYCLVYIRSNADWLMEPDLQTREEALNLLPEDLREMVDCKADDFTTSLRRFRQEKEAKAFGEQHKIETDEASSTNWRPKNQKRKSRNEEDNVYSAKNYGADENANPTEGSELATPLMRMNISLGNEIIQEIKNNIARMWNSMQKTSPSEYNTPDEILDLNLKKVMSTAGFSVLNNILGYDCHDLRQDAENDAETAYNKFFQAFIDFRKHDSARLNLMMFTYHNISKTHMPLFRFLMVQALSLTENELISNKAKIEINDFQNSNFENYKKMHIVSQWCSLLFEMFNLTLCSCRNGLQSVLEPDAGMQIFYHSLLCARVSRCLFRQLISEIHLAETRPINPLHTIEYDDIQLATVLPLLGLLKFVTHILVNKGRLLNEVAIITKEERKVTQSGITNEILFGLKALKHWVDNEIGINYETQKRNRNILQSLRTLFELVTTLQPVMENEEKLDFTKNVHDILNNESVFEEKCPEHVSMREYNNEMAAFDATMQKLLTQERIDDRCNRMLSEIQEVLSRALN